VLGAERGAVEAEDPAAFEDAVDDGRRQVGVVEHAAPALEGLVGREDHRATAQVAVVDDVEEHVGRVASVGEVADLVDHEHGGMGVGREGLHEASLATGAREIVDERGGGGEERLEAVLDGAVREGDGEVRLAAARLAGEDQATALGDEVGRERGAEQREPQRRLVREVELLDGLEEGEAGAAREPLHPGLLAMGHFLGHEHSEEVAVGPLLLLRLLGERGVDARRVGEVQAAEEAVERDVGGVHCGSAPGRGEAWASCR
jgi:hypothetical protein